MAAFDHVPRRLTARRGRRGVAPRLTDDERAVVRLLLRRPVAGMPRDHVAEGLGWAEDRLLATLASLVDGERLTVTGADAGHVRLLPGEALMHGQQPSADGLRWVSVRIGRRFRPLRPSLTAADDRRRPASAADVAATDEDGLPWPLVIITGSGTAWSECRPIPGQRCPACLGKRLAPSHICLRCLRWGLDHRIRYLWRAGSKGVRT